MSLHYQYADMHCDTLLHGLGKGVNDIYDMPDAMLDIKRMAEANVLCQFFAVFFPPRPEMLTPQEREKRLKAGRPEMPPDEELFSKAVRLMKDSFAAHKDVIRQAYCFDDVMKNKEQGLISGVLTVEDGRMVNGSFERLEQLAKTVYAQLRLHGTLKTVLVRQTRVIQRLCLRVLAHLVRKP